MGRQMEVATACSAGTLTHCVSEASVQTALLQVAVYQVQEFRFGLFGRSGEVVWAGIGRQSSGVGPGEMAVVREAVVVARGERLKLEKLTSIKPYSNHT